MKGDLSKEIGIGLMVLLFLFCFGVCHVCAQSTFEEDF